MLYDKYCKHPEPHVRSKQTREIETHIATLAVLNEQVGEASRLLNRSVLYCADGTTRLGHIRCVCLMFVSACTFTFCVSAYQSSLCFAYEQLFSY
jgi:hypothetical protein